MIDPTYRVQRYCIIKLIMHSARENLCNEGYLIFYNILIIFPSRYPLYFYFAKKLPSP